ncbi:transposable element Tc3 transposase [Trichonephila clavipes]|nr:transposable element Tc3 transposase [Trichonephila clavipes]
MISREKKGLCNADVVSISRSPDRKRLTDFGSPPIPIRVLWIANGDLFDILLFVKEISRYLEFLEISSTLRMGNTRPLPGNSSIGFINTCKNLHSGVHPPTTESNSVPVIWQNQARLLPEVHPEHSATASGRGSNGKTTVWCALSAGGIIGSYFFKNDEGHNVTVNGDRYRAMITNFFIPELKNHDVQELWFQQDGATCHTARATIDLLKDTFGDRLILRFGLVNWPPRSCDLTPLDYFLWGDVKSLVYADKPQTLDHLEDNIRRVIADIRPQMLEKVIENWTSRLDYIRASRGSPKPETIFKM